MISQQRNNTGEVSSVSLSLLACKGVCLLYCLHNMYNIWTVHVTVCLWWLLSAAARVVVILSVSVNPSAESASVDRRATQSRGSWLLSLQFRMTWWNLKMCTTAGVGLDKEVLGLWRNWGKVQLCFLKAESGNYNDTKAGAWLCS